MYRDYLTPLEIAGLWNMNVKTVYRLLHQMQEIGKWSDRMVKPKRAILVKPDAFEEFLQYRAWKEI